RIYAVTTTSQRKGGNSITTQIYSNGKRWSAFQAEKLLTFRKQARTALTVVMMIAVVQTTGYFTGNTWINTVELNSIRDWGHLVYSPFFAIWSDFGKRFLLDFRR